jgi:chaperonin GroEL (HSP60 family)
MTEHDTETNVFDSMSVDELQDAVEQMSADLRNAKIALRDKRLSGVRAALEARREADADLNEELRKIGHRAGSRSLKVYRTVDFRL